MRAAEKSPGQPASVCQRLASGTRSANLITTESPIDCSIGSYRFRSSLIEGFLSLSFSLSERFTRNAKSKFLHLYYKFCRPQMFHREFRENTPSKMPHWECFASRMPHRECLIESASLNVLHPEYPPHAAENVLIVERDANCCWRFQLVACRHLSFY